MSTLSSVQIRQAGRDDLDIVVPLFDAYRRFYRQAPDAAAARAYLLERLQHEEAVILLAESEGTAVGFTLLYPGFSSVRMARAHVLNDLYVVPEARRKGIGLALLEAAAAFARSCGSMRISLETAHDNQPAQALYRRAGWHEDDTQWFFLELASDEPAR
ncbi:MAG: GNAT family N-acetyltransferase [Rhodanobacteraceae bacterium]